MKFLFKMLIFACWLLCYSKILYITLENFNTCKVQVSKVLRCISVPCSAPDGCVVWRPAPAARALREDRRGQHRHRVHGRGEGQRAARRRQEDEPAQAAAPGAALQ